SQPARFGNSGRDSRGRGRPARGADPGAVQTETRAQDLSRARLWRPASADGTLARSFGGGKTGGPDSNGGGSGPCGRGMPDENRSHGWTRTTGVTPAAGTAHRTKPPTAGAMREARAADR